MAFTPLGSVTEQVKSVSVADDTCIVLHQLSSLHAMGIGTGAPFWENALESNKMKRNTNSWRIFNLIYDVPQCFSAYRLCIYNGNTKIVIIISMPVKMKGGMSLGICKNQFDGVWFKSLTKSE